MLGFEDLYELCAELAHSQGFYGRLLASLNEMSDEEIADIDNVIKEQNFTNKLDLILWLEG